MHSACNQPALSLQSARRGERARAQEDALRRTRSGGRAQEDALRRTRSGGRA